MRLLIIILMLSVSGVFIACSKENEKMDAPDNQYDKDEPESLDKLYFPRPDSDEGWRYVTGADDIREVAGMNKTKLDEAYDFIRSNFEENGGLLVVRHGYLVYERYFGKAQRDYTPNLASCGKPFTSIAIGILMEQYPELFQDSLDQKIFTPTYLPPDAFPLSDQRKADIKLGQLLSFSAGIRGNNPVTGNGTQIEINPAGPDGWYACVDKYALGIEEGRDYWKDTPFSAKTLWCEPGEGYSYATASIHIASIIVRHISGMELEEFIDIHLAKPLGWGSWGYGYNNASPLLTHTPGGAGICLRSTDMLRFCYMMLHMGRWEGKQLVPKSYIEAATKTSPYNPHYPFSLQFNVNTNGEISSLPADAYWKTGSGGYAFYIVPSLDLIVWRIGGRRQQYSSADIDLPVPEPLPNPEKAITNGHKYNGNKTARVLELLISAIVDVD